MKILKEGVLPTKQIECPHCHSVLEYDKNDIKKTGGFDDNGNAIQYIKCAFCKENINV